MTTTTTLSPAPVTEQAVLDVLSKENAPLPTLVIAWRLAERAGISDDDFPITRLRRCLDRLEDKGQIISSGGPKRAELMGWPVTDGRDVQWSTIAVAERIRDEHNANVERIVAEQNERAQLLRDLHARCVHSQRAGLNLIGIGPRLSADINYRADSGATTWSLNELRIVCELAGIESY